MKIQIFHHAKTYNLQEVPLQRNQNPSYYNYITNLKFQHKPKYIIFQNSSYKK
jgi:hypothetical protein